jgi:hypothetical protein
MSDQNDSNYGAAPPNGTSTPWEPAAPVPPAPPVPPMTPPTAPQPPVSSAKRNSGIGFGIFLIAIGLIFLAGQVVPGLAWWNLWPLIVVLVGVIQMFTPSHRDEWGPERIMDGLGTVIIGLVLLGNTLGIISWTVWWTFITLWPVLLISLGIGLLGKGLGQSWMRVIAPLLIWLALGYAVAVSFTGVSGFQPMPQFTRPVASGQPFAYMEPVDGVTSATLNLKGGAGEIAITGGTDLVNASGTTPFGTPTFSVERSGSSASVEFALADSSGTVVVPGINAARTDVTLSETTVWDATLETGATSMDVDLSTVPVRQLTLKTGASSAKVKLGQVPQTALATDVSIKAGVSSIEVLVPRDAEVRIDTHNGLSATDVDRNFSGMGAGVWQTAGYDSASKTINISVESGISSISVRTY